MERGEKALQHPCPGFGFGFIRSVRGAFGFFLKHSAYNGGAAKLERIHLSPFPKLHTQSTLS